jgi:hypothetical protein
MADMVGSVAIDATHAHGLLDSALAELESAVARDRSAEGTGRTITPATAPGQQAAAAQGQLAAALGPPKTALVERPEVPTAAAGWLRVVSSIEGTVVSVNTTFFGKAWAAEQAETRWSGRVTRWEDKSHRAVYILWDGEQRAQCVRLENLENGEHEALAERS